MLEIFLFYLVAILIVAVFILILYIKKANFGELSLIKSDTGLPIGSSVPFFYAFDRNDCKVTFSSYERETIIIVIDPKCKPCVDNITSYTNICKALLKKNTDAIIIIMGPRPGSILEDKMSDTTFYYTGDGESQFAFDYNVKLLPSHYRISAYGKVMSSGSLSFLKI